MSNPHHSPDQIDPDEIISRAHGEIDTLRMELDHVHRLATLGTMAAGIVHEINNLLTPALSYAHLAKSNPDDQAMQRKAIEKSITCIDTASRIAQHILEFGSPRHECAEANVQECVDAAIDCLVRDPAKDRIKVEMNLHTGTRAAMRPIALQQVLLNLFLNSCSAMRGKGGVLKINSIERSDGTLMITVSDTGQGLEPEVATRMFQPFVSTKRQPKDARREGGSGLGLMICQRLVAEAGGTISVDSKPGFGTRMSIIVPAVKANRSKVG